MLIVAVVFDFAPGGFERIKEEILDAIENSRKEEGAQIYDWALDVTAPDRAIIFEVWNDQAALDAHFTHPYMDTLVEFLWEPFDKFFQSWGGVRKYLQKLTYHRC